MSTIFPLAVVAQPVWQDFSVVLTKIGASESVRIIILDGQLSPEVAQALPDANLWRDASSESSTQTLLLTAVGTTALDATTNNLPQLHVELSSALQDFVMDACNSAWPIVRTVSAGPAVAEPALIDGRASWVEHGRVVADIGHLADVIESRD